jgi:hypothetical protein
MKRTLYCAGCHAKVAIIRDGSLLKGMVVLCPKCETKRKASDLAQQTKPKSVFDSIFGSGFGRGFR